ncbi:hypothetical protein K501DRAFT_270599 [Backusella circina FSU 941]|nr:hypothetical protein K501DRAFT_270599 [Backusella circina FSU 941]
MTTVPGTHFTKEKLEADRKEKKKLEQKQHRTQEEIETLEQLNITYKIAGTWKDVPMLASEDIKHDKKAVNEAVANYKDEIQILRNQIQLLEQEKNSKIASLENENRAYRTASLNQTQKLEALNQEKATWEHRKQYADTEIASLKASKATLEQLLESKEAVIVSLNGEKTQKSLLQAKTNETELLKQNMEHLLANEHRRNDALEQEIRMLKTIPLNNNISSRNIESSQHDHYDDPNNDINYDTEISNAEESEDDNINYDTPSEDGNN